MHTTSTCFRLAPAPFFATNTVHIVSSVVGDQQVAIEGEAIVRYRQGVRMYDLQPKEGEEDAMVQVGGWPGWHIL